MSEPLGELAPPRALPPGQVPREDLPVRHYGPVPRRLPDPWPIAIGGGLATTTLSTTLNDLRADLAPRTQYADFHCASGWSVLDIKWTGIPAAGLLELAPPPPGVSDVLVYGEYGYAANVRVEDLYDERAILATAMNGSDLTKDHGAPVRLVLPQLYCWKGPKWFRGWDYVDPAVAGFWESRGYHRIGDVWAEQRHSLDDPPPEMP